MASCRIPLSVLIKNPVVRAAFERAERDEGDAYAVSNEPKPVLAGGEAVPA